MEIKDACIYIRDLRLYAFHGVLPQERKVGGWYTLSLRVHYYILKAMDSDNVDDTLNYAALLELIRNEMKQPSALIEHVAGRIAKSVFARYPDAHALDLTITKDNPPMGANCQGAGVELHLTNNKSNH